MTPRASPLEPLWRTKAVALRSQFGMPVPARCGDGDIERARLGRVGIVDVSGWPRATVKGSSCAEVVARGGFPVPDAWFEPRARGAWAFAARTGRSEYFVEGWASEVASADTRTFVRQDASLLLAGPALPEVLAEILAIPIDLGTPRLHMIEAARVSCVLMPRPGGGRREGERGEVPAVQVWVDPTFAAWFTEALIGIGEELGGGFVGVEICERDGLLPAET